MNLQEDEQLCLSYLESQLGGLAHPLSGFQREKFPHIFGWK